jgi:hypothetical protein
MVAVEAKWLFSLWHTATGCTLQILKWYLSAETGYIKATNVRMNCSRLVMIPNSVIPLSHLYKQHWIGFVNWTRTCLLCVTSKSSVFWDIMPYNLLKVDLCFRVTCYLHLQGWKINQASRTLYLLSPLPRWLVPLNRLLTFNRPHGILFQKIEFLIPLLWGPHEKFSSAKFFFPQIAN